jgi:NAD(P)-dependent dehydrogenase (short-subunit alcohol dehydrogenase family)
MSILFRLEVSNYSERKTIGMGEAAYGSTKLMNVLFAKRLHAHEAANGVAVCSPQPGSMIATDVARGTEHDIASGSTEIATTASTLSTRRCAGGAALVRNVAEQASSSTRVLERDKSAAAEHSISCRGLRYRACPSACPH